MDVLEECPVGVCAAGVFLLGGLSAVSAAGCSGGGGADACASFLAVVEVRAGGGYGGAVGDEGLCGCCRGDAGSLPIRVF